MQEIKIYHSVWKSLLLVILGFSFTIFLWRMLQIPPANTPFFIKLITWIGLLFLGFCSLYMLFLLLHQLLTRQPYLTITDQCVIIKTVRTQVINFADVNSFELITYRNNKFIGIHYKRGVANRKNKGANRFDRIIRNLNKRLVNTPETISTTCLTMKTEQLCNLLNERLKQFSS